MLSALQNAWKISELRKKILFTIAMFAVYRLGAHIPVPGVIPGALKELFSQGGLLGFLDLFSGGALARFSVFALGINPYITASIILQLLTVVIPKLEQLAREGQEGRRKMAQYTRYLTAVLGLIQATGITFWLRGLNYQSPMLKSTDGFSLFLIIITLTAGTTFIMWLGEQINEYGIGNGISLLIFASIISRIPSGIAKVVNYVILGEVNILNALLFVIIAAAVIIAIVMIQEGSRRIPVQYAQRVVGRKMYGGQSTHIPMKVNSAGVMPVIFGSSVLLFPATIAQFIDKPWAQSIKNILSPGEPLYIILYAFLVIFFTYFYTAIMFNPIEIADNMKKNGGFIPGLRPGKPTAEYLQRVLNRITLAGAVFLAIIAIMPDMIIGITNIPNIYFGGTSLLIVVGVSLDTMRQIETYLLMRHYEGFLK